MEDKLFFVLFYFKCYPTFDLAGILFDFDRSQANRWLHRLPSGNGRMEETDGVILLMTTKELESQLLALSQPIS